MCNTKKYLTMCYLSMKFGLMPIYQYVCKKCWASDEQHHSIDNRHSPDSCTKCGGQHVLVISRPAIHVPDSNIGRVYRSDAEMAAVAGRNDWRETPESRRMKSGERDKLYSYTGSHG